MKWNTDQIAFLEAHYTDKTPDEIVAAVGRPWHGIKIKAHRMGLNRQKSMFDHTAMCTDYAAGLPISELLSKYSVSTQTVYRVIKQAGLEHRSSPLVIDDVETFKSDWQTTPIEDLVIKYKVSRPTIWAKAKELGLERPRALQFRRSRLPSVEQLSKYYLDDNMSSVEIAKQCTGNSNNCSHIRTVLRNNGVVKPAKQRAEKTAATCVERYGVAHPSESAEIQAKSVATNMDRYGVENPQQCREVRAKAEATCLERYGSISPLGSKEIQAKVIATCMERYGQPSPPNKFGKTQSEIGAWLEEVTGRKFVSDRTILSGKEIDLYCEELRFGIEYCGLYWHNEHSPSPRGKDYHHSKYRICQQQGIRLVTIFEDEWALRSDQVKSFLRSALHQNSVKLYARKCDLIEVDKPQARQFFDRYHIQGAPGLGRYFAGLTDPDHGLVACMSFGRHHRKADQLVLDRLCFQTDCSVAGGSSRLFRHLLKQAGTNQIVSWSDNRWSQGAVYRALGFVESEQLSPDYSYYCLETDSRVSKQSQKKGAVDCPAHLTEREWCLERGLFRVWDCGKTRWQYGG